MPLVAYTGPEAKLVRTKVGLTPDPDVFLPATAIADALAMAWALPGQRRHGGFDRLSKLLLTVTFRTAAGLEIVGTYDAEAFAVLPQGTSGDSDPSMRPKVQKLGEVTTQPSEEPMVVDVGRHEAFGLRLTNISAATATHVYITAQEWG